MKSIQLPSNTLDKAILTAWRALVLGLMVTLATVTVTLAYGSILSVIATAEPAALLPLAAAVACGTLAGLLARFRDDLIGD